MTEPKVKIIRYEPEHLEKIQLQKSQDTERPTEIRGEALTFMVSEDPIAIVSWVFIMEGVMHVCAFVSDSAKLSPLSFHRQIKHMISYAFWKFKLRRMQMSVRCGFDVGWEWAHALGFRCEGTMRAYGHDGQPYWLFARTP